MELKEFALGYVRMRYAARGIQAEIKETNNEIVAKTTDKTDHYLIVEELTPNLIEEGTIMTLNTKKNVELLAKEWSHFEKQEKLTIIFFNLETGDKWAIKPYHHAKISEKNNIKQGLISLHNQAAGNSTE